ncbi:MAG: J domain-containing protein [Actinobacteria bacterium]|nr:J domain-containing protein [Actinomycetota bacterium]
MASRYWKRMRQKAVSNADEVAPTANPWEEPDPLAAIDLNLSARPEVSSEERVAQYTEWAQRMREKRERTRDAIAGRDDQERSTYWTSEAVYAESRRVEEEEITTRPNPWKVQELLAVFELDAAADARDIGDAYRRLAKRHHPDRYVSADVETQQHHADKMASINKAYKALKQLQRA